MEYFNQISSQYMQSLDCGNNNYKIKLEVLSFYENVLGEIIKDIPTTAQGQININYQQLVRRSCSLSLINIDNRYRPDQNAWFWIDRKFKLWIGLELATTGDTYWFSQGVFYANGVNCDGHTVSINGIDKGGRLDGSLKTNMLDGNYVVEKGSSIATLIKRTLLLNAGTYLIDSTFPVVDIQFNKINIEEDISINDGEYIGALFTAVGDSYGSDIYYDTEGRLNFVHSVENNSPDAYLYLDAKYHFTDKNANYSASSLQYNYDVVNAVTVYTNVSAQDEHGNDIENASYTAYNTNPLSPLNIYAIGIRKMEAVEIRYINNLTPDEMTQRCKEYANYLLKRKAMLQLSIGFNSIIIPHLDVNNVVTVTDKAKGLDAERFVIQSITIPLSAGEMSIQAVNITQLPKDTNIEKR